jgi:hypothetical protein
MTCPVPDSHRRLDDVHAEWHDALDAYFDVHKFRRTYNSFLTAVQSTIDTISRKKRVIPRAEQKINNWRASLSPDRFHRWGDKARNLVIHEADLSLHSVAWLEYTSLRHDTVTNRIDVDPETSNEDLLTAFLMGTPEGIRTGLIKISRKWVASTLPDTELLEAGTHLYRNVAQLVRSFHQDEDHDCSGLGLPERSCQSGAHEFSLPDCMAWMPQAPLTQSVDIETRQGLAMKVASIERDPDMTSDKLRQHYGDYFELKGDPIQIAPRQLRRASLFLTVDSEALPWMMLYKGSQYIGAFQIAAAGGGTMKIAVFQAMAERIRATQADGFIFTSELWTAHRTGRTKKIHQHDATFYDRRPERDEALAVVAASRDGRKLMMLREFTRDDRGWPTLGGITTFSHLTAEWRPVLAALNQLPAGSAFRRG